MGDTNCRGPGAATSAAAAAPARECATYQSIRHGACVSWSEEEEAILSQVLGQLGTRPSKLEGWGKVAAMYNKRIALLDPPRTERTAGALCRKFERGIAAPWSDSSSTRAPASALANKVPSSPPLPSAPPPAPPSDVPAASPPPEDPVEPVTRESASIAATRTRRATRPPRELPAGTTFPGGGLDHQPAPRVSAPKPSASPVAGRDTDRVILVVDDLDDAPAELPAAPAPSPGRGPVVQSPRKRAALHSIRPDAAAADDDDDDDDQDTRRLSSLSSITHWANKRQRTDGPRVEAIRGFCAALDDFVEAANDDVRDDLRVLRQRVDDLASAVRLQDRKIEDIRSSFRLLTRHLRAVPRAEPA